jgi:hypothetical protein
MRQLALTAFPQRKGRNAVMPLGAVEIQSEVMKKLVGVVGGRHGQGDSLLLSSDDQRTCSIHHPSIDRRFSSIGTYDKLVWVDLGSGTAAFGPQPFSDQVSPNALASPFRAPNNELSGTRKSQSSLSGRSLAAE